LDKLFKLYLQELVAWNEKFNLTAITDPADIQHKHFDDSLLLLQVIKLTNESVIDVGAGAGNADSGMARGALEAAGDGTAATWPWQPRRGSWQPRREAGPSA